MYPGGVPFTTAPPLATEAAAGIAWERPDDDGLPEVMARWMPDPGGAEHGVLQVRRDVLLAFLRCFDHNLALFYEENIYTGAVPDGWQDAGREDDRTWKAWAEDAGGQVRAVLRCVTVLEPPGSEPERRYGHTLEFVRATGEPITARHPPDEFLTPVFFRREVLDRYLANPAHYTVTQREVRAAAGTYRSR